jgi:hypothetical protein
MTYAQTNHILVQQLTDARTQAEKSELECAALRKALEEINGLRGKWPNWGWDSLYEESSEIARTALRSHPASTTEMGEPDAPREGKA